MGKWDFQAIEILDGDDAIDTMKALYQAQSEVDGMAIDHQFRAYHTLGHNGKRYLHIGWDNCNALAYKVLKHLGKERDIISSYSGVGFSTYAETLNAPQMFSADAGEEFNPPITFDEFQQKQYIWQPQPVNIWVSMNPKNSLQWHVLQKMEKRLRAFGCIFNQNPKQKTPLGSSAHLAIVFGESIQEEISPFSILGRLPKPRGRVLMITTVENLPTTNLFDFARGQVVKKASHIAILFFGNKNGTTIKKALWASTQGNYHLFKGGDEALYDNLTLRVLAHASAQKLNKQEEEATRISWDAWKKSPVHSDIAQAAHALFGAGIIDDKIDLDKYGSRKQVKRVLMILNKAAVGEGMQSQLDTNLRIMGITRTGGGKANVSSNPMAGHIVPVSQLTWNGYVTAIPQSCPITFAPPSAETHENGMVYLAGALINAGIVNSFDSFVSFIKEHFANHDKIDILPHGMQAKATCIEHFHWQPKKESIKDSSKVEIVYPDYERFPLVDFPCGVRETFFLLLSALLLSKTFRKPGALDKVIIAILPGHGSVAVYGGKRQEMTNILCNGMEMEQITRI